MEGEHQAELTVTPGTHQVELTVNPLGARGNGELHLMLPQTPPPPPRTPFPAHACSLCAYDTYLRCKKTLQALGTDVVESHVQMH